MKNSFYPIFFSILLAIVLALTGWPTSMPVLAQMGNLVPLSDITQISAGGGHTCALTINGGVKCWGYNSDGRLGDSTTLTRTNPVNVTGFVTGAMVIAVGGYHTCAIQTTGEPKCWGYNGSGQLGDGTTFNQTTPVDIVGLTSGIKMLDGGRFHACALTNGGGMKCWGENYYGQLGDGTRTQRFTPVDVNNFTSGVIAVAVGDIHTCALLDTGGVKCWGGNNHGVLGGTSTDLYTPVNVNGLSSGVIAITAYGNHTCALLSGGGVRCWGYNYYGELGDGTNIDRYTPVDVSGLTSGVIAISAGYEHTCVLMSNGGVKCWGRNWAGQLGDGTTINHSTPVDVLGLTTGVTAIASGGSHTCARNNLGGVKCWGDNYYGELGDGATTNHSSPVDVMVEAQSTPTPTFTPTATSTFAPTAPNTPTNTAVPTITPAPESTPTSTPEPTVVTGRVEGKVIDQNTQAGIPDVLMTLTGASGAIVQGSNRNACASTQIISGQVYTTTTDLNGVYVFPAVKLGAYTLTGDKAGIVIQSPAPLVISTDGTVQMSPLPATQAKRTIYLPLVAR